MDNKFIIVALLVGLVSRVALLTEPLWYDEAFTLRLAWLNLSDLLLATAYDVHPPAWYILEWFTVRVLGSAPWALRIPALLLGLLSIWVAHRVFEQLNLIEPARSIATGLMTLSPFLIYHSAEARMYSLLLSLVLLSAWSALNRDWFLLGLFLFLGMLTHNLMALYIPALVAVYFLQGGRDLAKVIFSLGLPYTIWLPALFIQARVVSNSYWILPLTPGRLVYTVHQVLAGNWLETAITLPVAVATLLLLALGLIEAVKQRKWQLLTLAFAPLIVGAVLSLIKPVLIDRVLIGSVPFMLALIALGWLWVYHQIGRWAAILSVTTLALISINFYSMPIKPDYASYYGQLPVQSGDHCYHLTPGSNILASIYLPQCDHYTWSAPHKPNGVSPETIKIIGLDERPLELAPPGTTWLFHTEEPYSTPGEFEERKRILSQYQAEDFLLFENDFVAMRAWRLDR